jgi:hypothetical protein
VHGGRLRRAAVLRDVPAARWSRRLPGPLVPCSGLNSRCSGAGSTPIVARRLRRALRSACPALDQPNRSAWPEALLWLRCHPCRSVVLVGFNRAGPRPGKERVLLPGPCQAEPSGPCGSGRLWLCGGEHFGGGCRGGGSGGLVGCCFVEWFPGYQQADEQRRAERPRPRRRRCRPLLRRVRSPLAG